MAEIEGAIRRQSYQHSYRNLRTRLRLTSYSIFLQLFAISDFTPVPTPDIFGAQWSQGAYPSI